VKGGAILPLIVAAITPLLVLLVLVSGVGLGLVAWQPPILWTNTFGGSTGGDNAAAGVSADGSGVYLVGYTNYAGIGSPGGSLVLNKYDPSSGLLWTHNIGNSSAAVLAVSVGPDGVYLTGGNSSFRSFVQKFDLSGNRIWARNSTDGEGVVVTATGVYLGGESKVSGYDLDGNRVWTSQLLNETGQVLSVFADSSGIYGTGSVGGVLPTQTQLGGGDAFLVKYSLNGSLAWARQFATEFIDEGDSVSGDSNGIYVSGTTTPLGGLPGIGWLRKYDFNGNLDWLVRIDSPDGSGMGNSALATDSSGIYVSSATGSQREYLMKYDPQGGQIWSFQMSRPRDIYAIGTAYRLGTASGAVYVAGSLARENGLSLSTGFISRLSSVASLVLFGLNPPLSFIILAGLIGGSVISILGFRRLRRKRTRPERMGPPSSSLPTTD